VGFKSFYGLGIGLSVYEGHMAGNNSIEENYVAVGEYDPPRNKDIPLSSGLPSSFFVPYIYSY